jgi:hypothetical protein
MHFAESTIMDCPEEVTITAFYYQPMLYTGEPAFHHSWL